jgi:PAS domain S-box-containing protein
MTQALPACYRMRDLTRMCTARATGRTRHVISKRTSHRAAALAPGPHAIVSADREGVIRDWNETAEHIFGHSAGQAIGQTLDLVVPEEERADHWRNFRRVMATGLLSYRPDHVLDVEGLRRDGTRVTLDVALIAIPDEAGRLVGITAIMREADRNPIA